MNIVSASYNAQGSIDVVLQDMPPGTTITVPDWAPGQLEAFKSPRAWKEGDPDPPPPPNMDRIDIQEWQDAGGVIAPYEAGQ